MGGSWNGCSSEPSVLKRFSTINPFWGNPIYNISISAATTWGKQLASILSPQVPRARKKRARPEMDCCCNGKCTNKTWLFFRKIMEKLVVSVWQKSNAWIWFLWFLSTVIWRQWKRSHPNSSGSLTLLHSKSGHRMSPICCLLLLCEVQHSQWSSLPKLPNINWVISKLSN